jgi:hypothetical protein
VGGGGASAIGATSSVPPTPADSVAATSTTAVPGAESTAVPADAGTTVAAPETTAVPAGETTAAGQATTVPVETTVAPAPPSSAYPVVALGDSVMLGAAPQLAAVLPPGSYIDAVVGRQFLQAKEIIDSLKAQGLLGSTVIIHLGNNGPTNSDTFNQLMGSLADVPKVLFLTVKVERKWEGAVNQVLYDNVPGHPNAKLVYWRDLAEPNRGWFYDDGIHLRPDGARAYADIIRANL